MPTVQQCHAMVDYYIKAYSARYEEKPIVNRNTARWGFDGILRSMPTPEAKKLVDYYFETESPNQHSADWLFRNYDKLLIAMRDTEADRKERARLRAESKKRTEEWLASGHRGIASYQRSTEE